MLSFNYKTTLLNMKQKKQNSNALSVYTYVLLNSVYRSNKNINQKKSINMHFLSSIVSLNNNLTLNKDFLDAHIITNSKNYFNHNKVGYDAINTYSIIKLLKNNKIFLYTKKDHQVNSKKLYLNYEKGLINYEKEHSN
jgi:hypothetical protein